MSLVSVSIDVGEGEMSMVFKGDGLSAGIAMLVLWFAVKQQEPIASKGTPLAN